MQVLKKFALLALVSSLFVLPFALAAETPSPLHVEGNRVKDAAGQVVRLRGVNIASLEWSNTGEHLNQSVQTAIEQWRANIIRLPLSQDRWFGHASGQKDGGAAYRQIVQDVAKAASARSAYLLLDLHWSNTGLWGKHIGQHKMPDTNSITFWKAVAETYANNPAVLFDLYNEPHDVSWEIWKNGGTVKEKIKDKLQTNEISYDAPGMQKLIDTVRATGAKNIVVIGGLDWAYDLTGINKGYALTDKNGSGIIYASHIYPWKGPSAQNWDPKVGIIADKYPILVGEVGCDEKSKPEPAVWAPRILKYIEERELHWTAWCFHPSAGPCIIKNWTYEPTPYWGAYAKEALLKSATK